jgi:hypothetical protein
LHFEVADSVPRSWPVFDVAFSHEVLYLIYDLSAHADAILEALAPGGSYYAVMGVHAATPLMADWHRAHVEELQLAPGPYIRSGDGAGSGAGAGNHEHEVGVQRDQCALGLDRLELSRDSC